MLLEPASTIRSRVNWEPTGTVSGPSGAKWAKASMLVGVLVGVAVSVLVGVDVLVGVLVGVLEGVLVGVLVGVRVKVLLGVKVGVIVKVGVRVKVGGMVKVGVRVGVGVMVGGRGGVLVGPATQEGNLNELMRVCQGAPPDVGRYSVVNQNVQSSEGSTDMAL